MTIPFSNRVAHALFGNRNNHPFLQVFAWRLWRYFTRFRYRKQVANSTMQQVKSRGVQILGVSNVDELSATVSALLVNVPVRSGYCSLPREKNSIVAPLIYRVLQQHNDAIENYFRSHFRVNWFEIQKIVEGKQSAGSSFGYHTDDVPDEVMKLFIYLTDCTERTGAFRTFDYDTTDALLRLGMLESSSPGVQRERAQQLVSNDLERDLIVVEGEKGTVFMFDNNLIHKGTLPHEGQRIHVSMELMPSVRPLDLAEFSRNCTLPIGEYFPRNPFRTLRSL